MKKLWIVLVVLLVGCGSKLSEEKPLTVLSPYGAPSIAFLEQLKQDNEAITLVAGTDLLLAELVKATPNYDMVVAPINMGISLLNKDQTNFKLLAIISWGNLYVVGHDQSLNSQENSLAMFGKDAVPEKIASFVMEGKVLAQKQYVASVLDAQTQLMTNKAEAAMLAEPFVTKTLKENPDLSIIFDVQANYQEKTGLDNYPQAALFVNVEAYNEKTEAIHDYVTSIREYVLMVQEDNTVLLDDLNNVGVQALGLPSAELVVDAFDRMNVDVWFAKDKQEEVTQFMDLFGLQVVDDMIVDAS